MRQMAFRYIFYTFLFLFSLITNDQQIKDTFLLPPLQHSFFSSSLNLLLPSFPPGFHHHGLPSPLQPQTLGRVVVSPIRDGKDGAGKIKLFLHQGFCLLFLWLRETALKSEEDFCFLFFLFVWMIWFGSTLFFCSSSCLCGRLCRIPRWRIRDMFVFVLREEDGDLETKERCLVARAMIPLNCFD